MYTSDVPNINVAAQLFSNMAILRYQAGQKLQNTTKEMYGTIGTTLNVPLFSKLEMQPGGFAPTNLPVSEITSSNVQVVQNAYVLKTVIGVAQKTLFNFDYIRALAESHGKAMGRMIDQIKIAAIFDDPDIDPATDYYNVAKTVGANTGMLQQKLTDARSNLEYGGVEFDPGMGSIWLPSLNFINYFQDQTVTNQFFSNQLPLVMGQLNQFLGISHRKMAGPGAGNNYIPFTTSGSTTTFTIPLINKDAVQLAFNVSPQTQITYVRQELRWEIVTLIVAGCKVIQNNGIAIINADNPSTSTELQVEYHRVKAAALAEAEVEAFSEEIFRDKRTPTMAEFTQLKELQAKARKTNRMPGALSTVKGDGFAGKTMFKKVATNVDPNNIDPAVFVGV